MGLTERVSVRVLRTPGAYLSALLVGVLVTATVTVILQRSPNDPVPLAAVTTLTSLVIALLLWLRDPLGPARSGALPWFLIAIIGVWSYQVFLSVLRDEGPRYAALLLPAVVLLIALRTPVGLSARNVATVFAWAVLGVSAVTVVLEATAWLPNSADRSSSGPSTFESTEYFLPLSGLLNIDGRWAGPFGHANLAGPMGAYVLIIGLTRRGATRITFVLGGVMILLLAGSRSAFVAACVGVALLAVVRWTTRPSDVSRRLRLLLVLAGTAAVTAVVVARNPGLTGRTALWPQVIDLWRSSPWLGVGNTGFWRAIDEQRLPDWAIHAHNVFLDAGTRTGVVGLALCLVAVGLVIVLALSAARRGDGLGLALAGMIVTASLTDATLLWRYLTGGMIVLLLAALVSAPTPDDSPDPAPPPAPGRGSDPGLDREPSAATD